MISVFVRCRGILTNRYRYFISLENNTYISMLLYLFNMFVSFHVGIQVSIVECVSGTTNTVIPDDQCDAASRPNPTQTSCYAGACPTTQWQVQQGPCSVTCGNGISQQIVRCFSSTQGYVSDVYCDQGSKPTPAQLPCFEDPCPSVNNWSVVPGQCSRTCGPGESIDLQYY